MTVKELKVYIKSALANLPTCWGSKCYDNATIDEGLMQVEDYGKRLAYEDILGRLDKNEFH